VAFTQVLGSNPNRLAGPEVRGSSMLYSHSIQTYRLQDNFSKPFCSRAIDMQCKDPTKLGFELWSQPNRKSKAKIFGRIMFVSDSPITWNHPIRDRMRDKTVAFIQILGSNPNRLGGPEVRGSSMLYSHSIQTYRRQDNFSKPFCSRAIVMQSNLRTPQNWVSNLGPNQTGSPRPRCLSAKFLYRIAL